MPSAKFLKQRIRSVKNTAQITKAMEVVSATKMRKSQEFALGARPYATASLELLKNLLRRTPSLPPLLKTRPVKKSALLVITSDKGLAGAFNANVLRKAEALIKEHNLGAPLPSIAVITVGKKAKDYFERRVSASVRDLPCPRLSAVLDSASVRDFLSPRQSAILVDRSFWGFGDYSRPEQTLPVADHILNGFLFGQWDEVLAIYTNFRTTLSQEAVVRKILPATKVGLGEVIRGILPERGKYAEETRDKRQETSYRYEYKFEPSADEVLNMLVPQLIRMHIHHIILESNASEHSARMVAMKNASDNASGLMSELNLEFNKSRQASITRELVEITAGAEAQSL